MQTELIEMFAVPLTVSTYEKSIFQELKFIENLDYKDNIQGLTRISKDFFILNRPELSDLKKFIEHQFKKNRSEEKSKQIRRSLSIEIENKLEAEMQGINKVKVN